MWPTLVIIPCLNEEQALPNVLHDLPVAREQLRVVVVDNGSTDRSAEIAKSLGAEVVTETERGYGAACLRGLREHDGEPLVAFLDADYSDHPEELSLLLAPLKRQEADLVIGSRMLRPDSRRALLFHSRLGNRLGAFLLRRLYGHRCTDLGPFRALTREALAGLGMRDRGYGWTVEMQAKAGIQGLRTVEVPVKYRPRIGRSKISGTLAGSLGASFKILFTLFRLLREKRARQARE